VQPVAFCKRCRGMTVGWNRRYVLHCVSCNQWISKSSKLLILSILVTVLVTIQTPSAFVFSDQDLHLASQNPVVRASVVSLENSGVAAGVAPMEAFLEQQQIDNSRIGRVAEAIVHTSRKYSIDSRLVASIMIVESRANPFAISDRGSIGIMQIHLPTWGETADQEGINLFKVEDNIDLGVRILKQYVDRYGLWQGVKRYKGWNPDNPVSEQNAEEYVEKIQRIYASKKPFAPERP